jgi:hypothetical protein
LFLFSVVSGESAASDTSDTAIHKEKIPLSNDELVERLAHITNREEKSCKNQ